MKNAFLLAFPYFSQLIYVLACSFPTSRSYVPNFYKSMRCLQWGTHKHLAGGKMRKNRLMDILLIGISSRYSHHAQFTLRKEETVAESQGKTCLRSVGISFRAGSVCDPLMFPRWQYSFMVGNTYVNLLNA
jgi:hypothetical protein